MVTAIAPRSTRRPEARCEQHLSGSAFITEPATQTRFGTHNGSNPSTSYGFAKLGANF
ncbi:hypothetical protein KCP77_10325 [Salmonella enterica subsp. enterica]|nr:hypothetical protein KCP77_10325 [Salmonella enterica subsp. enterica]